MTSQTSWPRVTAFFLAGVAGAFLVGKAATVLPLLREDLNLSLFQAGLVVALFNLISGCGGILFGALADRLGHARVGLAGLLTAAAGSFIGAFVQTPEALLASRIMEGLGFFLTIVSMPSLLMQAATRQDRHKVMGLWGAYMPTGTASMMLAGGLLASYVGWRGVWVFSAVLIVAVAVLVLIAARTQDAGKRPAHPISFADIAAVSRHRGPVLLALIFAAYAGQYLGVTAFIPLILVENAGWSVAAAGAASAGVIASNILGNLASAPALDAGYSRKAVILSATSAMILGQVMVLTDGLPISARIFGGLMFSAVCGLIPGALFSGVAQHAPSPSLISTVNGIMMQGSSIGQLLLPLLVSWVVGISGFWASALYVTLPAAAIITLAAISLGRLEARQPATP